MEVEILSSTVLFNGESHPGVTESPLTVFDLVAKNGHLAVLYVVKPPTATNAELKDGLLKTLHHFPTLVGRLVDEGDSQLRPRLVLGGDGGGVLVVESRVELVLEEHLPLQPSPELTRFHPPCEGAKHLLQVQLNRFACGGLVIGVTNHHRVADGKSMSAFFAAWGRSVRGLPIDPLPVYDQIVIKPRKPPQCEYQHWGVQFQPPSLLPSSTGLTQTPPQAQKVANIILHYSSEFISKLKAQLPRNYTTFNALLGHVWRQITKARGLEEKVITQIRVATNGRLRLQPMVPMEYFGNMVLFAIGSATVKELLEGSVMEAAGIVHDAVRGFGEQYFRSFIDFGAMNEGMLAAATKGGSMLFPKLEADCWLRMGFDEVDFGGEGGVCAFMPSWIPLEGVVVFIPTMHKDDKGGVDVVVSLFEEHAQRLKEISHSLED